MPRIAGANHLGGMRAGGQITFRIIRQGNPGSARWVKQRFVNAERWSNGPEGYNKRRGLVMEIRYYLDAETGLPHIYAHGVTEVEAEWILAHPVEDGPCAGGSRQALGPTQAGRYLRVVYVPDEDGDGVFVITAYPLAGKQLQAFRRRQRRRKR